MGRITIEGDGIEGGWKWAQRDPEKGVKRENELLGYPRRRKLAVVGRRQGREMISCHAIWETIIMIRNDWETTSHLSPGYVNFEVTETGKVT